MSRQGGDNFEVAASEVERSDSQAAEQITLKGEPSVVLIDDKKEPSSSEEPKDDADTLIVDWDGPDDPANPKNWSYGRKWAATAIVSAFTFISPVSSVMITPASGQVAQEFGVTNDVVIALMTSIFVLAYAIGPLFLGPLSEIYGRSRVLQASNMWYLVWNLVCSFARTTPQFLLFRFFAGLGGSAPLAIGGGVVGDTWHPHERGMALSVYALGPLVGPAIAPLAGAWIAEKSTWKWTFWSTSIVDAGIQLLGLFVLQETYAPVLLERKANRIRKSQSHDPEKLPTYKVIRSVYASEDRSMRRIFERALTRPFALFYYEKIIQLLGVYMGFTYGLLYLFLTTMSAMFEGIYHQSAGIAGLHFLTLGIGLSVASQINARVMDRVYIYLTKKNEGVGKPEYRLPPMVPGTILTPIGLLIAGWSVQAKTHWIVPDIGITLIGAGTIINMQGIQSYVIDAFTLHAASGLAAVNFLRAMAGFGFPLFAPAMYQALGYGKGNTLLAVLGIVLGCPAPILFWVYGERIRRSSKYAVP